MSNSNLPTKKQKPKFSVAMTTPKYQELINNTLKDPDRARRFVATITSSVAVNPALQECDAGTILAGALLGESLNLHPSPQLGQYYLVPFESALKDNDGKVMYLLDDNGNKVKDDKGKWIKLTTKKAQFILGYKGYMQLAMRSGQLKKINVSEIKEGELRHFDPLNEEIDCILIEDWNKRNAARTIGYYAFYELLNGFRKAMYWSREQMETHADTYSSAFSMESYRKLQNGEIPEKDMWKYSSHWYTNFDDMAKKTMIRQLISKGGCPMSTEMTMAYENDTQTIKLEDGNFITEAPELDEAPELPIIQAEPTDAPVVEQVDLDSLQ